MARLMMIKNAWQVLTCCACLSLYACATAPYGVVPAGCSGVPGDSRDPARDLAIAPPLQRDAQGEWRPQALVAVARPATSRFIPLLYVYNDEARYLHVSDLKMLGISDPAFTKVESEAYWGEDDGGRFYLVPWLDKCAQSSMLQAPIDFRAPHGGLLFVQFVASHCDECDAISRAIERALDEHSGMPARWVQISVPGNVGTLSRD